MKDTPAFKIGESKAKKSSVAINDICQELNVVGNQLNILIIDACRNNPDQLTRGLISNLENSLLGMILTNHLPFQTFIAYSTSVGKSASDGNATDGHSLYTKTLLENIEEENLPVESLFKRVRNTVYRGYDNLQLPWEYSCLTEEFCFNYGQLNPYFDKPYSESAYNDGTYVSLNSNVNEIISGLKSYTWDTQNVAFPPVNVENRNKSLTSSCVLSGISVSIIVCISSFVTYLLSTLSGELIYPAKGLKGRRPSFRAMETMCFSTIM